MRARELFATQSVLHAAGKQQAVQRALVLGQHAVWCTRHQPHPHQAELARAIARDRVDEIKGLLLSSVPNNLHSHDVFSWVPRGIRGWCTSAPFVPRVITTATKQSSR